MSNRRNFLKQVGLTGTLLAAPGTLLKSFANPFKGAVDLTNITLKGKVHSNGKGIEGVAVTDGINITTTGKNGSYELVSNNTAEFVYISIPSGYEIPNEKGIASFYSPIKRDSNIFTTDFALQKLKQDDTNHNFVVWADPQIKTKEDARLLKTQSAPDLRDLVKSYPAGTLFHGVGCGDLVWDEFDLFADYREAIHTANIPFFNVIGNHDLDMNARSDEGSADTFKKNFGPAYYSFNRGKIHYVVLDDVFFMGLEKHYMGYITEKQFQWLEQDLKFVKPGSTLVINLHIPTFTNQSKRDKKTEPEVGAVVMNRKRLYDMLKAYTVHFMSGHTHFNEVWIEGNLTEHNHGTVCGAWWSGPICGDGTPSGYGVYEVKGNELSWYYKATGQPKEHQIRIYAPGRHKDFPDEASINVWNYDKNWKLEWFADGKAMGRPEQRTAYDPWAYELYLGSAKPNIRKWVEPNLTDHIFFIKPASTVKTIKVVATDPFGKTYTETLNLSA
ncbi:calcineurin-like phosphoesterase C-terminal domain-containing protein [Desertivirga brevis]|uniref:calcineurin-like phosphoesterase C-terminal domain-containing protein n=1 Tax=Desertivirga brevis TaxID=2810310 RepID=UPI001A979200|nr:calcineurin-like phosphoesterase family protein [Pedobacter sp. SYSU D00873]